MSEESDRKHEPHDGVSFRYWAFLSYSHQDEKWAAWLHRSLETFTAHRRLRLADRTTALPPRLYPIFRDREELASAADLPQRIQEALADSRFLVVLCSPRSAKSRWVNDEIRSFKALGREDRVLAMIVDGEPNASDRGGEQECFPEALRYRVDPTGRLTNTKTEVLAADVRTGRDSKRIGLVRLAAALLNVGFEDLRRRDEQRRQRLRIVGSAASLTVLAVVSALAIVAWVQMGRAETGRLDALSGRLAAEARLEMDTRLDVSMLLAASAARIKPTIEARSVLLSALTRLPQITSFSHLREPLADAALTPDQRGLRTISLSGRIRLLEFSRAAPSEVMQLMLNSRQLALNSRRKNIAILSDDGRSVSVIDDSTSAETARVAAQPGSAVDSFVWSADGSFLGIAFDDGRIVLHTDGGDVELGRLHDFLPHGRVRVAFSGDGGTIVAADSSGLAVWSTDGLRYRDIDLRPDLPSQSTSGLAVNQDGSIVAIGAPHAVTLWRVRAQKPQPEQLVIQERPVQGVMFEVYALAFTPDSRFLVVGRGDGTVFVWTLGELQFGRLLTPLITQAHGSAISKVLVADNSRLAVTVGADGSVVEWDLTRSSRVAKMVKNADDTGSVVFLLALSPNEKLLAAADLRGRLSLWDLDHASSLASYTHSTSDPLRDLAFTPQGDMLIGLHETGRLSVHRPGPGLPIVESRNPDEFGRAVLSPRGNFVARGTPDGRIELKDPVSGTTRFDLNVAKGPVTALAFDHDDKVVAVIDDAGTVSVWDLDRRTLLRRLESLPDKLVNLAIGAKGQIVFGHSGGRISGSAADGRFELGDPLLPGAASASVALGPGGTTMATGYVNPKSLSTEGSLRLLELPSFSQLGPELAASKWGISALTFSRSGRLLVSGGADGSIVLWTLDVETWLGTACRTVNRNLDCTEWRRYFGDQPYSSRSAPCPEFPLPTC